MRWAVAPLAALLLLALAPGPAAADTGTVCGTLQALRWPNGLAGTAGAATIDGRTYELGVAWASNGTNKIGRAATIGSQVCLSGDLAPGTTDVVTSFVLDACASCAAVVEAGLGPAGVGGGPVPLWIAAIAAIGSLTAVVAGRRRPPPHLTIRTGTVGRLPLGRVPAIGRRAAVSRSVRRHAALPEAVLGNDLLDRAS